jgi:hypothetical protein
LESDLICVVTTDIDAAVEEGFNQWYEDHILEVVEQPGWVRATRYRCLDGEPRYMAVYDIASREQGAIGSYTNWTAEMQAIQQAGYEQYWPHIESYKARNYERISRVLARPAR